MVTLLPISFFMRYEKPRSTWEQHVKIMKRTYLVKCGPVSKPEEDLQMHEEWPENKSLLWRLYPQVLGKIDMVGLTSK